MRKLMFAATFLGLVMAGHAVAQVNSTDLKWGPPPPQFPKGAQMAVLLGDPTKAGLFIVRVKMPAGYKVQAHHHPTDEVVTVLSGDLSLGMGDKLDVKKGAHLRSGGFAVAPALMNHYAWSNAGAVIQIGAQGPFGMTYVNPADDPSRRK